MRTSITFKILSVGVCAASLAACNGGGTPTTGGGSGSESEGSTDSTDSTTTTTTTTTDGTVTEPTGGSMSNGMTMATTEATMGTGNTTAGMVCGNGEAEGDEECDDGNQDPGDGCEPDCTITPAVCGDMMVGGDEECDDGNQDPGDGCEPDCTTTPSECGNEMIEAGETCDDGNTDPGDGCDENCQTEMMMAECGNNMVEPPEECDDGNVDPGDGCEADCTITPPECGNGIKEAGEECDDGNMVDGGPMDFCKNNCTAYVPPMCQAPAMYEICDNGPNILTDKADKKNALRAIGICDLQPDNSIVTTAFEFDAMAQNNTWQVAKGFGTYTYDDDMDPNTPNKLLYSPREGQTFLMLSSGVIKAPNNMGIVIENANSQVGNGNNNNSDVDTLPAPFKTKVGSNNGAGGTPFKSCDNGVMNGDNDCSDTLQAQWTLGNSNPNDRVYFTFKTKVPLGTFGYTFDFVFCSAEWPTYVNTGFNDLLIAYQVDPTMDDPNQNPPVDPYSGNVTFIQDPNDMNKGLPLTITALDPYFDGPGYTFNEPQLAGTGFEQHACSDWFTAKGGVQPGAEVTIGFYLADMSDSILATVALLDNFRWDCQGCIPSEVNECGVQPM